MVQQRKIHPDFMRAFSTYLVILGHSGIAGYLYYMRMTEPLPRFLFMMLTGLIQASAVPTYAIISGALLLPREEPISKVLKKRVLNIFLVLVTFSLISYVFTSLRHGQPMSVWAFLCNLYSYEQVYSYWYLYAYLAFLVVLPFLRILAQRMTETEYRYLFAVAFLYYVSVPIAFLVLREPLSPSGNFVPFVVQTLVIFPFIGHYIENRLDDSVFTRKNVIRVLLLVLAGILFETVVQYLYWIRYHGAEYSPDLYLSSLNIIPSSGIYFIAKAFFLHHRVGDRLRKVILFFSSTSFGVFLLHHIYLTETAPVGKFLKLHLGTFPGNLVWVLLICLFGTAVSWILKKLPGFRKLL